jgi:transposase
LKAKEQHRSDVIEKRETFHDQSASIDPERFVFLDECGIMSNMTRMYGRALKGERLMDDPPHGHWQTTRLVSAMRLEGVVASMALDGAIDQMAFEMYVAQLLAPNLRTDDIVVMDNLAAHHSAEAIAAIEAVGATAWFLPPDSPDLNPIESMGSKVKQAVRRQAARTFETLIEAVGHALTTVTPADCRGFFQGYAYCPCDR